MDLIEYYESRGFKRGEDILGIPALDTHNIKHGRHVILTCVGETRKLKRRNHIKILGPYDVSNHIVRVVIFRDEYKTIEDLIKHHLTVAPVIAIRGTHG